MRTTLLNNKKKPLKSHDTIPVVKNTGIKNVPDDIRTCGGSAGVIVSNGKLAFCKVIFI
jgi:hypothetical protein